MCSSAWRRPVAAVLFVTASLAVPVQLPAQAPPPVEGRTAGEALDGLDVGEGLEATLFAAEPLLLNPSNIDVDHLGRVWVCEVVNYRSRSNTRPEGDRILILEDTDHDGRADKQTVFYQGRDVDSALGICVLGNRVIVSCAPNVFIFTDDDHDGHADRKELLFTKVGDQQHDHSTHAFTFGPDGKLYFNVGNTGHAVHDKDGNPIVDLDGNVVNDSGQPYRQGLVFRCNLDGSDFEVLGHNFRNNYEVTVDSFGTLWQSDNDDDGNRAVRINFVMEFGNYGYTDELTGAGWKTPRTGMHDDIPLRHWHLNDPGVVPNLLQTGAGSPTGICLYEGRLLPEVFRGEIIHADAGPNVVRAYPTKKSGAGYTAEIVNVLEGTRDQWFRPSDVCVAPDGSLIIADWYDPGVGGHRMGDVERGRLFRIAPPGTGYEVPTYNFETISGAIRALRSPNLEARYLGWTALHERGVGAEKALLKVYNSNALRMRARALWLLSKIEGRGRQHIETALEDKNPDIRITALRAARELRLDMIPYITQLAGDKSPQVRRECLIALRHSDAPEAADLWAGLARKYNGKDRWYLEALGIAADKQWDRFLAAWFDAVGENWNTPAGRDILWRSRGSATAGYLAQIIQDPATPTADLPRYFRSLDFVDPASRAQAAGVLALSQPTGDPLRKITILAESVNRLDGGNLGDHPEYQQALATLLDETRGTAEFVSLVTRFGVTDRYGELLEIALANADGQLGVDAIRVLLDQNERRLLKQALEDRDPERAQAAARVLGASGDNAAATLLGPIVEDRSAPLAVRQEAVRALGKTKRGANDLVAFAESGALDPQLAAVAAFALHASGIEEIKAQANRLFPLPPSKDAEPLPPLPELIASRGSVDRGLKIFQSTGTCANCHLVNKQGKEVGPDLTEIGDKLSRSAMFESIIYPSAGISHNYESYTVVLSSGNVVTGLLTTQTPDSISIRSADAITREFPRSDVEEMVKQDISLMPADLQKTMTAQDLVDVVEYLQTLKKAKP